MAVTTTSARVTAIASATTPAAAILACGEALGVAL